MAPLDRIDTDAARMSYFMEKASKVVLIRLKLRTEGHTSDKIIRYPDRIELGNSVFRSLGFDNKQKKRALEALEAAKHIKIQWRGNQSPLIVLTATGFRKISSLGSTT
jgi:hypothetical protein